MKGQGPRFERETVIIFNEESDTAAIWTASETVYRRLKKRGFMPAEDGERHASFTVPKRAVLLPRLKKPMPEAQREKLRERAAGFPRRPKSQIEI